MDKKLRFSKMLFMGSFIHNPALTQAIGICTIVAIGTTLKVSLTFSIILSALLIIMECLSSLILKKFSRWIRISAYMLLSTLILLPVMLFMDKNISELSAAMGIYLPLLSVNSIVVIRCEVFAVKNKFRHSLFDAVASALGFGVAAVIIGLVREMLAYGTIWGKTISHLPRLSGMALPFGGLLVLGFLAAFHKFIILRRFPRYPTNTFNLRTAFDKPELRNDGIGVTKGRLSFLRDPSPERETTEPAANVKAEKITPAFEFDEEDDIFGVLNIKPETNTAEEDSPALESDDKDDISGILKEEEPFDFSEEKEEE